MAAVVEFPRGHQAPEKASHGTKRTPLDGFDIYPDVGMKKTPVG